MKAYFSVIKLLQPVMSKDANTILTCYFRLQRQLADRSTARTTVRMLESLSRLAEGSSVFVCLFLRPFNSSRFFDPV